MRKIFLFASFIFLGSALFLQCKKKESTPAPSNSNNTTSKTDSVVVGNNTYYLTEGKWYDNGQSYIISGDKAGSFPKITLTFSAPMPTQEGSSNMYNIGPASLCNFSIATDSQTQWQGASGTVTVTVMSGGVKKVTFSNADIMNIVTSATSKASLSLSSKQ